VNNAIEAAGGTSFASPIFAGLLALAQQKVGSPLGNVNYVLYKLASTQYADASKASACTAANATAGNACVFYDVTTGSNAVPCRSGTTDCATAVSSDLFGILPGHSAAAGYDMATGLGSVNAENLVNGWTGAASTFLATTTSIAISGPASVSYGTPVNASVTVSPVSPATGTPSGDIGITSNSNAPNAISIGEATLSGGVATVSADPLPAGTYQLFARYAGDATFSPSQSAGGISITVARVAINASLTASNTTTQTGQYVALSLSLPGVTGALAPTGTATFTDTTTGAVLGSRLLTQGSGTSPVATASVTISAAQLHGGMNVISASYSGDANYAASTSSTVSITRAASFTASVNPGTLTLAPNGTGSVTVTATPVNGATLNPASLSFACPSSLPAGLACSFSAPAAGASGTVSSTLTLQLAGPLVVKGTQPLAKDDKRLLPGGLLGAGAAASLSCLLMIGIPRRRRMFLSLAAILAGTLSLTTLLSGCGSSGGKTTTTPSLIPTATSLSVNPSTPMLGTPVVLTAKVTPGAVTGSGTGTPTGSISFSSGNTSLGMANLSSGTASLTANSLPVGAQSITATYSGDATYATSTSSSGNVDVSFTTAITVTVANNAGDSNSTGLNVTVQ
jgi:hypothetical protein